MMGPCALRLPTAVLWASPNLTTVQHVSAQHTISSVCDWNNLLVRTPLRGNVIAPLRPAVLSLCLPRRPLMNAEERLSRIPPHKLPPPCNIFPLSKCDLDNAPARSSDPRSPQAHVEKTRVSCSNLDGLALLVLTLQCKLDSRRSFLESETRKLYAKNCARTSANRTTGGGVLGRLDLAYFEAGAEKETVLKGVDASTVRLPAGEGGAWPPPPQDVPPPPPPPPDENTGLGGWQTVRAWCFSRVLRAPASFSAYGHFCRMIPRFIASVPHAAVADVVVVVVVDGNLLCFFFFSAFLYLVIASFGFPGVVDVVGGAVERFDSWQECFVVFDGGGGDFAGAAAAAAVALAPCVTSTSSNSFLRGVVQLLFARLSR